MITRLPNRNLDSGRDNPATYTFSIYSGIVAYEKSVDINISEGPDLHISINFYLFREDKGEHTDTCTLTNGYFFADNYRSESE